MDKDLSNLPHIKAAQLDVPTVEKLAPIGDIGHPPRILLLYGSLQIEHVDVTSGEGMTCYFPRAKGDRQLKGGTFKVPCFPGCVR